MKNLFLIIVLISITGCRLHRVFYYQSEKFTGEGLSTIRVAPEEYTVFLREICNSDSSNKTPYEDCPAGGLHPGRNKIEVEYLFVSRNSDTVIYISNFPDKYETIYEWPGFQFGDTVRVNARYLSSVYIGKIDRTNNTILFEKSSKKGRRIAYQMSGNDIITFKNITETKKGKDQMTRQMTALKPVPKFNRYNYFYWMFNRYEKNIADQEAEVKLVDNAMYIGPGKDIYFHFAQPWGKEGKLWIRYADGRLITKKY